MIRRQDHLLQDPMVRLDFNKGTLANEHKEFYRSSGQQMQKLWCQKLDRHPAEADWKECSFSMWVILNSLNWKCFLSWLNRRVKMTVVDVVLTLGQFWQLGSFHLGEVCVGWSGPCAAAVAHSRPGWAAALQGERGRCRQVSPWELPELSWAPPSIPSSCLVSRALPALHAAQPALSSFPTNFFWTVKKEIWSYLVWTVFRGVMYCDLLMTFTACRSWDLAILMHVL